MANQSRSKSMTADLMHRAGSSICRQPRRKRWESSIAASLRSGWNLWKIRRRLEMPNNSSLNNKGKTYADVYCLATSGCHNRRNSNFDDSSVVELHCCDLFDRDGNFGLGTRVSSIVK